MTYETQVDWIILISHILKGFTRFVRVTIEFRVSFHSYLFSTNSDKENEVLDKLIV